MTPEDIERIIAKVKELTGKDIDHVNVVITGKTGTGKSTLINAIFGCQLADEGVGEQMTMKIVEYPRINDTVTTIAHRHLRLIDTRGIVISRIADDSIIKVKEYIKDKNETHDMTKHVHFVLYTVHAGCMRLEEEEYMFINAIEEQGIDVIIVMTQAIGDKLKLTAFETNIIARLRNVPVMRVLAKEMNRDDHTIAAFGIDQLVELITNRIPDQCRMANLNVDRLQKRKKADNIIIEMMGGVVNERFGGLAFHLFLWMHSETVAKIYDVSLGVSQETAWKQVVEASGVFGTMHGFYVRFPIVGPRYGGVVTREYFRKLIGALEQLHKTGDVEMKCVERHHLVEAIKKVV